MPSTVRDMPPSNWTFKPVAVTMMSASSCLPDSSWMPRLGEGRDAVGDDRGGAAADRLEQVGVGHRAQPLVPRVVGRVEVLVDRIARRAAAWR